jgi:hypothetical protein
LVVGPYFALNFTSTTIVFGNCIVTTCSKISASWFRTELISLTSSFAEFRDPVAYQVTNDLGDKVGALLSDGVQVSFNEVTYIAQTYYLCLDFSPEYLLEADLSVYSVYDFGIPTANYSTVHPAGFTVELKHNQLCSHVKAVNVATYFAIARIDDYASAVSPFDTSTLVQFYLLASMFLLSSIYGLVVLTIIIVQVLRGIQEFKIQLFLLLACLFAFNTSIRLATTKSNIIQFGVYTSF